MIGSVSSYAFDSRRPSRWSSSAARASSTWASSRTRTGNRNPRSWKDAISSGLRGSVRTSLTWLLLVFGKRDVARLFDACRSAERPEDDEILVLADARDPVRGVARNEADVAGGQLEPLADDALSPPPAEDHHDLFGVRVVVVLVRRLEWVRRLPERDQRSAGVRSD